MRHATRRMIAVAAALVLLGLALAALPPRADAVEPCCNITAIDMKSGTVTARDLASGRTFRFTVKDRAALRSLRVGQAAAVDTRAGQMQVHGAEPVGITVQGATPQLGR